MPSFRAYLTSWVVWLMFYRRKYSTEEQLLITVQKNWRSEYAQEVVPKWVAASSAIEVSDEKYVGKGQGGQTWKVFHCAPSSDAKTDKIVVYWHGGAFINAAAPQHWGVIHRLVKNHKLPVVFPQYTRAPEGTAEEWCLNAVRLMLSLSTDPRYKGKKVVHMGDSAGGWMALRMRLLILGLVLGEEKLQGLEDEEGFKGLADKLGPSILISPCANFEVTKELEEAEKLDPWLSISLTTTIRRLWFRGPSSVPEVDYDLPGSISFLTPSSTPDPTDKFYLEPRYSLNNGLDVLKRYKEKYPDTSPMRVLTMIGTYDICHVGCKPMQERLVKLGEGVVKADYIEEEGLLHVYPILDMPEAEKAWKKIGEVLKE